MRVLDGKVAIVTGGARGIGYFPDYWEESIRNEIRVVNRDILALAPALLGPSAKTTWSIENPVRVAARPEARRRSPGTAATDRADSRSSRCRAALRRCGLWDRCA